MDSKTYAFYVAGYKDQIKENHILQFEARHILICE